VSGRGASNAAPEAAEGVSYAAKVVDLARAGPSVATDARSFPGGTAPCVSRADARASARDPIVVDRDSILADRDSFLADRDSFLADRGEVDPEFRTRG